MYIVAIAWLYVVLLAAVSDTTVVGGVLTFVFWGVGPLGLFLWLVGTPARHRHASKVVCGEKTGANDSADPGVKQ
ncbi:MAG: hypothetical protein ROZ37_05705 [Aromatoleum sp.]|jgi:threonine dehydrogenase-like Zn-dependent dehydrogenase|uniref:hypothetical protein n=1 Tax=Aromatoleum sp. TaxID=2307007 RepID=UPI002894716B|nr:hypothetical protein [Aromatoleum sp.]MDT3669813.1 hypothetical protein [Aromatoleum sp.]